MNKKYNRSSRPRSYFLISSLVSLTLLSACSEKKESGATVSTATPKVAPVSPASAAKTPEQKLQAELMAAIFEDAYRADSGDALMSMPDEDHPETIEDYVISAVAQSVLPSGETILIGNAELAGQDGRPQSSHASPGLLNVFVLQKKAGKWQLLKHHKNVASLGSFGQIGVVKWIALAPGKPGMAILHGGTWQGYSIEQLSLFDLRAETIRDLSGGAISISSDSDGACEPETEKCWNVQGKWHFSLSESGASYEDLHIDFSGEESNLPADAKKEKQNEKEKSTTEPDTSKRIITKVNAQAVYAFDGKQYRLVKGENVVPGI